MAEPRVCTRCGVLLTDYASGGLCPCCLLRGALSDGAGAVSAGQAPSPVALAGRNFGDYDLLEEIAHGGMGVVYKARQRSLDRIVAVKLLLAGQFAEPRSIQRFRAEAEAVAHLHHPNIVAIHEIGEHEGYQYFSMDYVQGRNMAQVRSEFDVGMADFRRCARWVKTMAEAVHYAHQRGIIHRDLKPANVLIDELDQPHITDFGLAKRFVSGADSGAQAADLTLTGQVLGSPNYLPPEQAAGKTATPLSDVYSLGAILYHLLTGRPPFEADSLTSVLKQVLESEPVSPRLLNPGIPTDLATICQKCLEKEPSRRYKTAQALEEELGRFLAGEPIRARPVGAVGRVWKWCRRQPVRATLTGALSLVLVLGVIGVAWQSRRADAERDMALRHAYAGDMAVARLSLDEGNLGGALRLLDKHRPSAGARSKIDLRGWEWRYLWGLCRGDETATISQVAGLYVNLGLSPDGRWLVVQQMGGNIELWDWAARQHSGTLTNRGHPPALALSPDGKLIASANLDHNDRPVISLWDFGTRRAIRDLPQDSPVSSLAFSADSKLLAACHMGRLCSLWRVPSGEWVTNYPANYAVNMDMRIPRFSVDGTTLILSDWKANGQALDNVIRFIDLQTGSEREIPASSEGNCITALALTPDGQMLASGSGYSDGGIELWDLTALKRIVRLEGHRGWVKRLLFSADGRTLYSGGADQTVRAWDVADKKEIRRWQGHTDLVTGLALTPDGKLLLSCADDGSVRVWDTQAPIRPTEPLVLPVRVGPYGAPFTRDSRRLITASATAPVTVWEIATGRVVEHIPALGSNHLSVALSPDERWLATGSLDGWIQIWDRQQRTLASCFRAHTNSIYAMRFLVGDKSLLSFAMIPHQRWELKRWEAVTWREIPSGVGEVAGCNGFAPSPSRPQLVMVYGTGPTKLWDLRSGRLEATFGSESASMPAFSRDGRLLAVPTSGRGTLLWDLETKRLTGSIEKQINSMLSTAFSPDGKRVVTGSGVGGDLQPAIEIWDPVAGRGLLNLRSQGKFTGWVEFSPDGNTLLALSWNGVAELWRAPSWEEIEAEEKGKGTL